MTLQNGNGRATAPVRPEQCAMLFGVPIEESEFRPALADPTRDFVRNCCPIWPLFRREVAVPGASLVAQARSLGVTIVTRATPKKITEACRSAAVVVIVSHWVACSVEFRDGMHPIEAVVDAVPDAFDGVVDLLICVPRPLALALRKRKLDCVIRYAESTIRPRLWFPYFELLFARLAAANRSYLELSEELLKMFLTSHSKGGVA